MTDTITDYEVDYYTVHADAITGEWHMDTLELTGSIFLKGFFTWRDNMHRAHTTFRTEADTTAAVTIIWDRE